jgi:hypothetical protein
MWREDGVWVITDVETGVTTQGNTRQSAIELLDQAVALHNSESGRGPTRKELKSFGITPEQNVTGETEPPDALE